MKTDIRKTANFRRDIFERIAARDSNQLWLRASIKDVKRVVVVAAASRSGSSLLFALLKKIPCIYSLSGESVPFYKLNGLSGDAFFSDQIPVGTPFLQEQWFNLSRDFLSDISLAANENRAIKEEDMPRLFQQYEQLERKTGGTGLGLAISLEIIKAHGGKIWAESTFGQGTIMHFLLPIEERRKRT